MLKWVNSWGTKVSLLCFAGPYIRRTGGLVEVTMASRRKTMAPNSFGKASTDTKRSVDGMIGFTWLNLFAPKVACMFIYVFYRQFSKQGNGSRPD